MANMQPDCITKEFRTLIQRSLDKTEPCTGTVKVDFIKQLLETLTNPPKMVIKKTGPSTFERSVG